MIMNIPASASGISGPFLGAPLRILSFLAWLALVPAVWLSAQAPDASAEIQRRVDALPPGGTLVLEAGSLRFQGIRVTRSLTVRGAGIDRTHVARAGARPFFEVAGAGVEAAFEGLDLDGGGLPAAGLEAVGIRALRLRDVRVAACGVPPTGSLPDDSHGQPVDGVYAKDVDEARVERCVFLANARDGFIGIPVRRLVFAGNQSRGNGRMGCTSDVDPEHRAGGPLEAVYLDNQVEDCGTGGLHVESEPGLPPVEARFERNRVVGCGNRDWGYCWGLTLGLNARGLLRDNTIVGTGLRSSLAAYRNGIHIARPSGPVRIEGNRVLDSGRCGISVDESPAPVLLRDNVVQGAGDSGISAYRIRALRVEGCRVEGARREGLWARLCPGAEVIRCRFQGNSAGEPRAHPAVRLEACGRARLEGNDFGGEPQAWGVQASPRALALLLSLAGNRFEGRAGHPRLSNRPSGLVALGAALLVGVAGAAWIARRRRAAGRR